MEIIVPAAGLSTRYRSPKPKYLLFDANGELMLAAAVRPFISKFSITIGILAEHDNNFQVQDLLNRHIPQARIVVLPERTRGPADTVCQIIDRADIRGEFFVKDCDSFFDYNYQPGNVICTTDIAYHEIVRQLAAKSFVIANDQGLVLNIIEKQVVSNLFCVGGYQMVDSRLYKDVFLRLQSITSEIFVSHVIQEMIASGEIFVRQNVQNWVDVGTIDEWIVYNNNIAES